MSGDTLWLFIEKVVVCGTLVVKYEVTSFMTIECNMKMTLRGKKIDAIHDTFWLVSLRSL
jgi:hypothetical protein